MKKKGRRYTREFKLEAIKLVTKQGYTQSEAAKSLGISSKNLSRWIQESEKITSKTKSKATAEQEELQQLRKEVKRLKQEREILKKAAAFFANESN